MEMENLFEYLKANFVYKENSEEFVIRCGFCGDSVNPNSSHFYISKENPHSYHCKKCGASGILTEYVLEKFNMLDSAPDEVYTELLNNKRNYKRSKRFVNEKRRVKLEYNLGDPLGNDYNNKIAYLNNRLGINLSKDDCLKYKIITSIFGFMSLNPSVNKFIKTAYDKKREVIYHLEKNYIGFLTLENYIVFRTIEKEPKFRYYNLKIANNASKIYIPRSSIDISKSIEVILTEGIIDLIGVDKFVLNNYSNNTNRVLLSLNGADYYSTLIKFITTYGVIDPKILIFPDSDINTNYLIKQFQVAFSDFSIIINSKAKDYGRIKSEINPVKIFPQRRQNRLLI